jgi:Uma2 family endonuclease
MASVETLITAEEFGRMSDDGRRTELVQGRVVELPPPKLRHGKICHRVSLLIGIHVEAHDLGHVVINDTGIITERNPDSVRGADIAFYSYARMPKGPMPESYSGVAPDLVIEVRSPSDRWRDIHAKVAEYLKIGVLVVCVLDPEPRTAHLYYPDQADRALGPDDELTFPECLPGFSVPVRRFFE